MLIRLLHLFEFISEFHFRHHFSEVNGSFHKTCRYSVSCFCCFLSEKDEPKLTCEYCGWVDFAYTFKGSKRFCSMVCAKRRVTWVFTPLLFVTNLDNSATKEKPIKPEDLFWTGTTWAAQSGSDFSTQRGTKQQTAGAEDLTTAPLQRLKSRYRPPITLHPSSDYCFLNTFLYLLCTFYASCFLMR